MKRAWLVLVILVLGFVSAEARDVTLEWDPNTVAPDVYRLFQRINDELYDYKNPVKIPLVAEDGNIPGNRSTVTVLDLGVENQVTTYKWVIRAALLDPPLESGDSNEASIDIDLRYPTPPSDLTGSFDRNTSQLTLRWGQDETIPVSDWKVMYSNTTGGPYTDIGVVPFSSEAVYSAPLTIVPSGEKRTVYFVVVSYRIDGTYSQNSAELAVLVDRRVVMPPNLRKATLVIPVR